MLASTLHIFVFSPSDPPCHLLLDQRLPYQLTAISLLLPSTFFSKVCLSIVLYIFLWFVYIPLDCVNFSFLSSIGAVLLFMFYSSFNFVIHVTCDNDNKGIILFYSCLQA